MYKNIFLRAYTVPRDGSCLVITRDSCYKISNSTYSLISRLPGSGTEKDYLESLSFLGVKDPEGIFKKLIALKCLVWTDKSTKINNFLKELLNPAIELIPSSFQERIFPFLKEGLFKPETLFKFSLYGALTGLALSAVMPFLSGFRLSGQAILGGYENAAVVSLVLLSVLLHEFGHSVFAYLNGIGFRPIGFSVYLFFPVFYANISGVNELELKPKLSINMAGLALQSVYMCLILAAYSATGLAIFRAALLNISYLLIFNINPLINTDSYWCYKDIVAAYKGNKTVDYVAKLYSFVSFLFSLYLGYIAYNMAVQIALFAGKFSQGSWTKSGMAGALISAYILVIMLRGLVSRLKEGIVPKQAL